MTRELKKGEDGLTYDEDGHFIYTGISPLSEDTDIEDDEDAE